MKHNTKLNAVALAAIACVAAPLAGVLSAYAEDGTVPVFDPETSCTDSTICTFADGTLMVAAGAEVSFTVGGNDIHNVVNNGTLRLVGNKGTITATSEHAIINNSNLTIEGELTVDAQQHGKAALWNNSVAVLNGGTYRRSTEAGVGPGNNGGNSYYTILNHGEMKIYDGVVVENNGHFSSLFDNGYASYNSGSATSGYVQGENYEYPSLIIYGGTFSGGLNTIKNDDGATIDIRGGLYKNFTQAVFQNHNVATVSGGEFDGTNAREVINNHACDEVLDKGELTITGGKFITAEENGVIINDNGDFTGKIEISGGTFVNALPSASYIVSSMHLENGVVVANEVVANATEVSADVSAPTLGVTSANTLSAQLSKTGAIAALLNEKADVEVKLEAPAVGVEDLALYYDEIGAKAAAEVTGLTEGLDLLGAFNATLKIGNDTISELDEGITLALALPAETVDALKSVPEGKVRKYYVVRIHEEADGSYKVKRFGARLEGNFIVFENDRFSMLLVATELVDEVVEEEAAGEAEEEPEVGDHGAFTAESGSATAMALGTAIMVGIITAVVSFVKLNKRTNEQE